MATKKYLDENGLLYLWSQLKTKLAGKVDKADGKGLSTNDYTTTEKSKLSGIAENANNYSHPSGDGNLHVPATSTTNDGKVLKAGSTAGSLTWGTDNDTITTVNGKTGVIAKADIVALGIPGQDTVYTHPSTHSADIIVDGTTNKTYTATEQTKLEGVAIGATANAAYTSNPAMDGTASAGSNANFAKGDHVHPTDTSRAPLASPTFTGTPAAPTATAGTDSTQIATTAFVKSAINTAVGSITSISYEVVASLPGTGVAGKIYLLSNSGGAPNVYDEYIYVNSAFEKIGTTAVDLSGYLLTADLVAVTNLEIDTILAT